MGPTPSTRPSIARGIELSLHGTYLAGVFLLGCPILPRARIFAIQNLMPRPQARHHQRVLHVSASRNYWRRRWQQCAQLIMPVRSLNRVGYKTPFSVPCPMPGLQRCCLQRIRWKQLPTRGSGRPSRSLYHAYSHEVQEPQSASLPPSRSPTSLGDLLFQIRGCNCVQR